MSGGTRPMPTKLAKDRMRIPQGSAKRNDSFPAGSCHFEIGNHMRPGINIFPGHWQEQTRQTGSRSCEIPAVKSVPEEYPGKNQAGKCF